MTINPQNQTTNGLQNENNANGHASNTILDIAVIGGGIVGVIVALGLLRRGLKVTVYERRLDFHEIGAGLVFPGVARECMQHIDPRILDALWRVGEQDPYPHYRYWDGLKTSSKENADVEDGLLFKMPTSGMDYCRCLRQHFLGEISKLLPDGVVVFGKQLESYVDDEMSDKVVVRFADGSTAEADAVIGCDGIHSSTRKILLGPDNLASQASYSHQVAYRAVVPIADGIAALGEEKANNQNTFMGPDACFHVYPVGKGTLLNVVTTLKNPDPWPDKEKMTAPAKRDELVHFFRDWCPAVREIIDLFPEHLTKWGIFCMSENPAPTYARGRVCIAGDAAHATQPFHGVGAGMGVEDALVLALALDIANFKVRENPGVSRASAVAKALETFSAIRLPRSQRLVASAKETGEIYERKFPGTEDDADRCRVEFARRSKEVWDFDVLDMMVETKGKCEVLFGGLRMDILRS